MKDALYVVGLIIILLFVFKYKDIEKHGLRSYYDQSKGYLHDVWYGK